MTIPNEQTSAEKKQIQEITQNTSTIVSNQYGDIIKNVQWYATLVIGEIAGIAKLTQTAKGWAFALFIISLICSLISISALIYASTTAQKIKFMIQSSLAKFVGDFTLEIRDTSLTEEEKESFKKSLEKIYESTQDNEPELASKFGLIAFLIGSIVGGLGICFAG